MLYILLVIIIILVFATAIFIIKSMIREKKALQFKIDSLDRRIEWHQKNRQAYQEIINKTTEGKNVSEKTKEKIYNTDGSDLANILNEL